MTRVFDYRTRAMLILAAAEVGPGNVVQVHVEHELDCPALRGHRCTCTPIVAATVDGCRWTADADGYVRMERRN
jgi:hypothetical protein